jgi:glutamyl-tRNA(Gln) amidotransferase subunit E
MTNPDEVKEVCDYIRFLNRSTGKVRTGIGAGRQDVNVSCTGGTRVEIKGVAHTKWIPELTHNECFRQWSLLLLRDSLRAKIGNYVNWKINHAYLDVHDYNFSYQPLIEIKEKKYHLIAVNLPGFKGALSHFTQPGRMFANELSERLKVIACLDVPNMIHSEELEPLLDQNDLHKIKQKLNASEDDAQILIWGPESDMPTALETIQERCIMAFNGIPPETRKSLKDGTTIFERVLPGADRMYPDTDSAPIPLEDSFIEELKSKLPQEVIERYNILKSWNAPEDTYTYIFKKDLFPLVERIINELGFDPVFVTTLFGHKLKYVEGQIKPAAEFNYKIVYALLKFLKDNNLQQELAWNMLPLAYKYPKLDFQSILESIKFKKVSVDDILAKIPFLKNKFAEIRFKENSSNEKEWIMGQLRKLAIGNIKLNDLSNLIKTY